MEDPEPDALRIGARLRAHLGAKIATWLGLAVGICVPYFSAQHFALAPPRSVPVLGIDRAIAFQPEWVFAYASLALLVPLAPLVATRRSQLRRYAIGLAALCVPSFVLFVLVPVEGPRPVLDAPQSGLYAAIVSVDRPSNSLPSLHAGLTVFSLLFANRVFGRELVGPARGAFVIGALIWGGLILYATLATKQHWLVDLPAGAGLALAADWLAWRSRSPDDDTRPAAER